MLFCFKFVSKIELVLLSFNVNQIVFLLNLVKETIVLIALIVCSMLYISLHNDYQVKSSSCKWLHSDT